MAEHRGITRLELLLYIKDVHSDQFAWVLVDEVFNERANLHFSGFSGQQKSQCQWRIDICSVEKTMGAMTIYAKKKQTKNT